MSPRRRLFKWRAEAHRRTARYGKLTARERLDVLHNKGGLLQRRALRDQKLGGVLY